MPKFYLYARKSTDDEDRQVLSIESQINELREYAKKENLEIVDEFTEAKSAKSPGRPIFSFMLKQIEAGFADGILAWHPDRLARNSIDGGKIIYLVDIGKITDLRFPIYRFDNTAQGKFMLSIAFGQSKYYVDNLAENVRRGMREKLRRGEWPAWAPLGYLHEYKNHTVIVDPEKAPFVRKMFELYSTGNYSLEELLREVRTWNLIGKAGKPVCKSSLVAILKNPFYYGVMRFKGELYEGSHPPLISKKLFDRVQEVMQIQAKPMKRGEIKFAFTGLMKCGECSGSITAEIQKGHIYYRCTKKFGKCSQKFLREEALLEQINNAILKVFIDNETKDKMISRLEELTQEESKASSSLSRQLQDKLKNFDDKLETLIDLYIAKEITSEEYQRKKAKLLNEKKDLQDRAGEIEKAGGGWLEPAREFITTCNQAGSVAWQGNLAAKRDFLKILGSNFKIFDRTLSFTIEKPFSLISRKGLKANWLPSVVASRTAQPQVVQLVVKMEIRRSKRILLSLIDPLPPKPIRLPPVYPNTIVEALKIKAFMSQGPTMLTWAQTRKALNISEAKLAHLLKIVKTLPPDFVETMKSCADANMLKIFHGRRLLKISRLKTDKERRNAINRLLPTA